MASSDPWITLKRNYELSFESLADPLKELYVIREGEVIGFVLIQMIGTFKGYIQSIAIKDEYRGKGFGSRLLEFAEERIFRQSPNVFMCVSSFNEQAKKLYLQKGYSIIGEIDNFIIEGYSEILMRKTKGPLHGYNR